VEVPERARHVETEVIPAEAVLLVRPHLWDLAGPTPSSENIREKVKKNHTARWAKTVISQNIQPFCNSFHIVKEGYPVLKMSYSLEKDSFLLIGVQGRHHYCVPYIVSVTVYYPVKCL
jgi:hypothetical protein